MDNLSPNESFEYLKEEFRGREDISVVSSGKNGGFSYGNNFGFRIAVKDGCDRIICTNNDVLFKENSIHILCEDLDKYPDVAVVGPKIYNRDGEVQKIAWRRGTAMNMLLERRFMRAFDIFGLVKKRYYSEKDFNSKFFPEEMVYGCCFIIRSSALVDIDYFDENTFLYCEEPIIGARLRQKGYRVLYDPDAEIIHWHSKTAESEINQAFLHYNYFANILYYLWNYAGTGRFMFAVDAFFFKLMMKVFGRKDKGYREYTKMLKERIKQIRKGGRQIRKKDLVRKLPEREA